MEDRIKLLGDIQEYASRHDKIIIYGAGNVGTMLCRDLTAMGIHVDGFAVSSSVGQLKKAEGVPVYDISELEFQDSTGVIIGVSLGKVKGIEKELRTRGYNEYTLLSQKYIDAVLEQFTAPKMEITTVIGCAVNCRYCPQKLLTGTYFKDCPDRPREMSLETFITCLDKIPSGTRIYFAGMSEPFQNSKCMDMIRYAVDKKYRVGVYTTGVGLSPEECDELVKLPIESVILHVPDEENYAHIRLEGEYWQIIEKLLDAEKRSGSGWKRFVDSGSCQGVPLRRFMEINKERIRVETYLHDRAGNLSDEDNKLEHCKSISGPIYCYHSGERLDHNILLPDGTVVLCCMDYGIKHALGNLLTETYDEILNGRCMKEIQKALKDSNNDILCRTCTYAVSCRQNTGI